MRCSKCKSEITSFMKPVFSLNVSVLNPPMGKITTASRCGRMIFCENCTDEFLKWYKESK